MALERMRMRVCGASARAGVRARTFYVKTAAEAIPALEGDAERKPFEELLQLPRRVLVVVPARTHQHMAHTHHTRTSTLMSTTDPHRKRRKNTMKSPPMHEAQTDAGNIIRIHKAPKQESKKAQGRLHAYMQRVRMRTTSHSCRYTIRGLP